MRLHNGIVKQQREVDIYPVTGCGCDTSSRFHVTSPLWPLNTDLRENLANRRWQKGQLFEVFHKCIEERLSKLHHRLYTLFLLVLPMSSTWRGDIMSFFQQSRFVIEFTGLDLLDTVSFSMLSKWMRLGRHLICGSVGLGENTLFANLSRIVPGHIGMVLISNFTHVDMFAAVQVRGLAWKSNFGDFLY